MPILTTPEVGIPLPFDTTPEEVEGFRERAKAACNTLLELMEAGAEIEPTDEDSQQAHALMATEKNFNVAKTPPGAILKLEAMLTHYDHEFLEANRRIFNLVTNKLLEETENEDPKIRLKALELLGKRKGVNAFSDQLEISIKHKPIEDIESELSRLLERYTGFSNVVDGELVEEQNEIKQLEIDLDAELGLKEPEEEAEEQVDGQEPA